MFRHCVYTKVLRASAPLTGAVTTISFAPFNRRGDGLFLIFQLANSVAGGTFTIEVVGSFDNGVTFIPLGATPNFVRTVNSGSLGDTVFRISGALPPIVGLRITLGGAPSGDVAVLARGSVGLDSAGVGYRPQDYVPPHTHGFGDGLTDYPVAFPLKNIARGIVVTPAIGAAVFANIPDMVLAGLVPPISAVNVRRWEATIKFTGQMHIAGGGAVGEFRLTRDGVELAGTLRLMGAGVDDYPLELEDVRAHEAGVAHTYAVQWRNVPGVGSLETTGIRRLFTVEFRPVA